MTRAGTRTAAIDFDLYLITDRKAVPGNDLPAAIAAALDGGVRAVQLREKDLPDTELLPLANELRSLTDSYSARLLINSRVDIALACGADGVHLGTGSTTIAEARAQLEPNRLIGFSTHNLDELATAERDGADFVTFGPVFATPSKLAYGQPVGLKAFTEACAASPLPIFALGGIDEMNLGELKPIGASGFSCIRAVLSAPSPADAARSMLTAWRS